MELIGAIVLLFDTVMATKIFGAMIRAKLDKNEYINSTFWTRIGILIIFHVVMLIITGVYLYIKAIVNATL